jgi:hypothetical protein
MKPLGEPWRLGAFAVEEMNNPLANLGVFAVQALPALPLRLKK